jgi:hypothetical protein
VTFAHRRTAHLRLRRIDNAALQCRIISSTHTFPLLPGFHFSSHFLHLSAPWNMPSPIPHLPTHSLLFIPHIPTSLSFPPTYLLHTLKGPLQLSFVFLSLASSPMVLDMTSRHRGAMQALMSKLSDASGPAVEATGHATAV